MSFEAREQVWDPVVRVGHWLLVGTVLAAWLTRHAPGKWHEWLGYGSLAIVAIRIVWGFVGPMRARFADFVRSPRATLRYAREMAAAREPRHLGHNPLGGWMVVALLTTVSLVGFTGWLYTTDRFWGVEWVEGLHDGLSNVLWALVFLHVGGVLLASYRHRENLAGAMIHGRKRGE